MNRKLNEQLIQIKESMGKKKKWENQMNDYKSELVELEDSIAQLENNLSDEMKDVRKLEGVSLTSLFQTFFGSKEEKLKKEKLEVAAVQLKLKEARKTEEEIRKAITVLEANLQGTTTVHEKYQDLLLRKEEMIRNSNSPSANELFRLGDQEAETRAYMIELKEAITAGEEVDYALRNAIDSLESAEGWGTFDMFGGGMISGMVKHSHIDEATNYIHAAQSKMRSFQKELLDVDQSTSMHIDISGMLKFADFFFDGLITDWMVQGRIESSLDEVTDRKLEVEKIIRNLNREMNLSEKRLEEIEKDKEALIVGY